MASGSFPLPCSGRDALAGAEDMPLAIAPPDVPPWEEPPADSLVVFADALSDSTGLLSLLWVWGEEDSPGAEELPAEDPALEEPGGEVLDGLEEADTDEAGTEETGEGELEEAGAEEAGADEAGTEEAGAGELEEAGTEEAGCAFHWAYNVRSVFTVMVCPVP